MSMSITGPSGIPGPDPSVIGHEFSLDVACLQRPGLLAGHCGPDPLPPGTAQFPGSVQRVAAPESLPSIHR